MSDWTWEYVPDADHVVGADVNGAKLGPEDRAQVERIARELADAAAVKY